MITRRDALLGGASAACLFATAAKADELFAALRAFDVSANLVTDFGADPSGALVSDSALVSFNTWFAAQTGNVQLVIPPGSYKFSETTADRIAKLRSTANSLTIAGHGATFLTDVYFGGSGGQRLGKQARVQSVGAGANAIKLVTLADYTKFSAGDWALITGIDLQGYGGPTNPQFFEHVKITSVDAGTGVVTFTAPLRNTYLSTWPHYTDATQFSIDQGGPATLYSYDQSWNMKLIVQGLTFAGRGNQTYVKFRHYEYHGCSWASGTPGPAPTDAVYILFNNCRFFSAGQEVDKLIETLIYRGCKGNNLTLQSASVTNLTIENCIFNNVQGSGGGNTLFYNVTANFMQIGPIAYGVPLGSHTWNNVSVGSISNPAGTLSVFASTLFTHVGSGVFTVAKTQGPFGWAVPGARCAVIGDKGQICQFNVTSLSEDGTNTIIGTDLGGPFPRPPLGWAARTSIAAMATRAVYATGCSGNDQIVNQNNAGTKGLPLNSYCKVTYQNNFSPATTFYLAGRLVSYSINVTLAYAGGSATVKFTPGQFHVFCTQPDSGFAAYDFMPSINVKVAGNRVFTPNSVTGIQSGDTNVSAPPSIWFAKFATPQLSASVTDGTVTIVIEATTDQSASP